MTGGRSVLTGGGLRRQDGACGDGRGSVVTGGGMW